MSWSSAALGELCEISIGRTPSRSESAYWSGGTEPWVSISDLRQEVVDETRESITELGARESGAKKVKAGTLLMSFKLSIGKLAFAGRDLYTNEAIAALTPKSQKLDSRYLWRSLERIDFDGAGNRAVMGNTLNKSSLAQIKLPIPPLDEQRRIAAILDKADALRQKRKRAIALLDSLTQSIFSDLFGDPSHNPLGLPVGKIGDLLDDTSYGSSGKAGPTGEYPMLRMGNLTPSGQMDYSDLKYIDLTENEVDRYTVKKGDILFNRTNSAELVGKTAVFDRDEPYAFAGYLVRARTSSGYSPEYVSGYLNSRHGKKTLRGMAKSIVGMANINAKEMQTIPILVPDQASQRQYSRLIEGIAGRRIRYDDSLGEIDTLFASLQHRAFSGQL